MAFSMTVNVDLGRLTEYRRGLVDKFHRHLRKTAFDIEGEAKERSPVLTGANRNSIYVSLGTGESSYASASSGANTARPGVDLTPEQKPPTTLSAVIGPSTSYASTLEFGSSGQSAQPFLIPAFENHRNAFEEGVKEIVDIG